MFDKPREVIQPYIDRLRALGVPGTVVVNCSISNFSGFFDWGGPDQYQFSFCETWSDVEFEAVAYVAAIEQRRERAELDSVLLGMGM